MTAAAKAIGIVGSRHFPRRAVVDTFVSALARETAIVSGGAEGVDTWAIETAMALGMPTSVIPADWDRWGRKAGPIRNAELVKQVDEVVAFWDERSRGTLNTVMLAMRAGLPVRIFDETGKLLATDHVVEEARRRGVVAAIEKAGG